jgi:glycosyltransferase involved in cell wall biosynthesis
MNILHLTTFLQGGAGRMIVELAREQRQLGHDVTIVASRHHVPGYGNYPEYLDMLSATGIPVHLVDSTFERSHARTVAAVAAVDRLIGREHNPDVVHAHAAVPGVIALMLAGIRRAPLRIVETMHGWGQAKTAEQGAADVSVLNLVDRVAVPSEHSAALLAALGVRTEHMTVVPYGVRTPAAALAEDDDVTWMAMTRARRAGRLVMACVGTFGTRKNQTLIIEALARLGTPAPLCVFIGDGDPAPLEQAAERLHCTDRVRIHGYSRSARALAAGADLLVLPSRSEGQPIAILEAFADGLLVAVSDIPELLELVENGTTGFIFRSDDPESLADLLARLTRLPNSTRRAIRTAARDRYASSFTMARMVDRYDQLYRGVNSPSRTKRRVARRAA